MMTRRRRCFQVRKSSASPYVRKDGSPCLYQLVCEDWKVVNAGEYIKVVTLLSSCCHQKTIAIHATRQATR